MLAAVDNIELLRVNDAIQSHPVEVVGRELRGAAADTLPASAPGLDCTHLRRARGDPMAREKRSLLCSMHCVPRTAFLALCSMHCVPRTAFLALCSSHCVRLEKQLQRSRRGAGCVWV